MNLDQVRGPAQGGRSPVYVLGINESHNCTAALLRDGQIVAVASEERFSRLKNDNGYPKQSVQFVMEYAGISPADLDLVVLTYRNPYHHFGLSFYPVDPGQQAAETGSRRVTMLRRAIHKGGQLIWRMGRSGGLMSRALDLLEKHAYDRVYAPAMWPRLRKVQYDNLSTDLGVPKQKIYSADHHLCHVLSALYFAPTPGDKTVVLSLDGAGDDCCGTVFVSEDGALECIAQTPNAYSLGFLYAITTEILGMRSYEHEYKVMGLAPYADTEGVQRVLPVFEEALRVEGLSLTGPLSTAASVHRIEKALRGQRFDWIAGAVQLHCENLMRDFASNAMDATGASSIVCGGGVFMNVKANMALKDLPGVTHFAVCPSAADESTAIGAAYHGYERLTGEQPSPLDTIYLGPEYSEQEIEEAIDRLGIAEQCRVERPDDVDRATAELLAEGQIVARFQGRMEFGARALGNRSILANPSDPELASAINHQKQQRDFWMPFAPTILDEFQDRYLVNPNRIPSPYMMIAFETTSAGREDLKAAIHPFDKTVRPQILREGDNPGYQRLIRMFHEQTGIGAVMNTSFNIHGEPVVCSPDDALETLLHSGLRHLAIDPYLFSKP